MDGVLRSWAVPKGPSYDMNDKRLAVRVEDHPLEYGDFEGIIPAGNYGAGGIIVWDRGEWVPLEDWREGLEKGKLLFELKGYKLHGKWTLVKIKKSEKDWLLSRSATRTSSQPGDVFPETVRALRAHGRGGQERADAREHASAKALEEADAPRTRSIRHTTPVMLAEPADEAFTRDGLAVRAQARRLSAARVQARAARRCSSPATATTTPRSSRRSRARCKALPLDACIIDGEVVVLDDERQAELLAAAATRAALVAARHQARRGRAAGDVLRRSTCWRSRTSTSGRCRSSRGSSCSRTLIPKLGAVRYLDHIEREGDAFLKQVDGVGPRGHHREESRRAVPRRAHATMAQDQGRAARATS